VGGLAFSHDGRNTRECSCPWPITNSSQATNFHETSVAFLESQEGLRGRRTKGKIASWSMSFLNLLNSSMITHSNFQSDYRL